jgi:protein-S-isoprenylcysteine O-methyltransferase Ste14
VVFFLHGVLSYLYMDINLPQFMPPLSPRPVLNWFAFVLIFGGVAGVILSMTRLGYGATMGGHSSSVRRKGIYGVTRNPQILFYTLVIIGYSLLWPNWLTVIWVLIYVFVAHMMVITEEEYLLMMYPEDFGEYCDDVPRYLFKL